MLDTLLSAYDIGIRFNGGVQPTVSEVNFMLFNRKTLALVGGSGKMLVATSLARLTERFSFKAVIF